MKKTDYLMDIIDSLPKNPTHISNEQIEKISDDVLRVMIRNKPEYAKTLLGVLNSRARTRRSRYEEAEQRREDVPKATAYTTWYGKGSVEDTSWAEKEFTEYSKKNLPNLTNSQLQRHLSTTIRFLNTKTSRWTDWQNTLEKIKARVSSREGFKSAEYSWLWRILKMVSGKLTTEYKYKDADKIGYTSKAQELVWKVMQENAPMANEEYTKTVEEDSYAQRIAEIVKNEMISAYERQQIEERKKAEEEEKEIQSRKGYNNVISKRGL